MLSGSVSVSPLLSYSLCTVSCIALIYRVRRWLSFVSIADAPLRDRTPRVGIEPTYTIGIGIGIGIGIVVTSRGEIDRTASDRQR